ncbi:hypothetical protein Scep_026604 [Stephania cephalantha]|uniref:Isopenicillin N synthase-like Fe(2+) 2OG dioxygenase domain-containing protein n=1 Tax=Stephania cephalantha TaxID=152367 RepID=A0AAP0EN13_9MAGN
MELKTERRSAPMEPIWGRDLGSGGVEGRLEFVRSGELKEGRAELLFVGGVEGRVRKNPWRAVQESAQGALQVNIGDHMEVLSNGVCKSVVHRAALNSETTRISIASLQSLGMDVKIRSADELVDEEHPRVYKETSFREFLKFLSTNDMSDGTSYIDTLRIKE